MTIDLYKWNGWPVYNAENTLWITVHYKEPIYINSLENACYETVLDQWKGLFCSLVS